MATVHLPAGLRAFAGGIDSLTIDAPHAHDLVTALGDRFPAMRPALEEMAVAIDGEIYAQAGYQPVRPDSEVHLLPRIAGGQTRLWATDRNSNRESRKRRRRQSSTSA